jgi:carbon-monoxide dehydrogenase medium subunit
MYPASFTYHAPKSLKEAFKLLSQHGGDAKLLAGGHSLLPAMKLRLASPAHLIDLKNLRDKLQSIGSKGKTVTVGSLSTYRMIEDSSVIQEKAPLLAETVVQIGDMQVRNVGTLGGSLAHADPAGDPPAAILALEAEMVIQGSAGKRTVAASDFFQGFFTTAVEQGEILTEVRIPVQKGGGSYQKFKHPASGYAVCGVAAVIEKKGGKVAKCRIGITGVSSGAYRATAVENALEGKAVNADLAAQAAAKAVDGIDPLEDPFAGADYRRQLAKTLTKRAILAAWERA